jgi:Domain of unknown function (DUF4349)
MDSKKSCTAVYQSTFWVLSLALAATIFSACSGPTAGHVAQAALLRTEAGVPVKSILSREHFVVVDIPEAQLNAGFERVASRCSSDAAHHCVILQSDLSSGNTPSGLIKLRIDPEAVEDLIALAAAQGKMERRSTRVEDIADAIADTQTHIEMLASYRKQLLELQAKAGTNVDAAIKIASELSTVQTNLERANGEAAYQAKRTTTDVVNIEFVVAEHKAFWQPVHEAFRDFLGNLSNGVSGAITAVAYIVPWLFVVLPGLYLIRFLWRRRGK